MWFEIISEIRQPETFARGTGIRELPRTTNRGQTTI